MTKPDHNQTSRERYYNSDIAIPPESDPLCLFRPCFHKSEDKGTFTVGRGYTSYHKDFRPVCNVRMVSGCPSWRGTQDDQADIVAAIAKAEALLDQNRRSRSKDGANRWYFGLKILREVRKLIAIKGVVDP